MKARFQRSVVVVIALFFLVGCTLNNRERASTSKVEDKNAPQKGERVPNNLVCMVTDIYNSNLKNEVFHEYKSYYGCSEACGEKIRQNTVVRFATDPHTLQKIDKAEAYIVLIGENGEVAYFESEANYIAFLKEKSS